MCESINLNLQRFWYYLWGTHWLPSSQWVLMWLSLIIQIIGVNYSNTVDEISWKEIGLVSPDCCLWYWGDGFECSIQQEESRPKERALDIWAARSQRSCWCWILYRGKPASFILYTSVNKCTKLWLVENFVSLEIMYVLQGCIMICWHTVLDVNPGNKQKDIF